MLKLKYELNLHMSFITFRECFDKLKEEGAQHIRIYARHTADTLQSTVDEATAIALSLYSSDNYDAARLDIAIGSRVRVTKNIATQLGEWLS